LSCTCTQNLNQKDFSEIQQGKMNKTLEINRVLELRSGGKSHAKYLEVCKLSVDCNSDHDSFSFYIHKGDYNQPSSGCHRIFRETLSILFSRAPLERVWLREKIDARVVVALPSKITSSIIWQSVVLVRVRISNYECLFPEEYTK
jgi:hypothetical protein